MTAQEKQQQDYGSQPIAVIGMAVRVPGGTDLASFWRLIESGEHAIRKLTPEELSAAGVPDEMIADPNYRPFAATLAQAETFEHTLFGLSEQEAAMMDVQHRVFLQVAWAALEDAGHIPQQVEPLTGVFASTRFSMRMVQNGLDLCSRNSAQVLQQVIGTDKDYLATRACYLLDLRGPGITVQSACSSSLVAVHLAVQSLLTGECDMALAGGVTINEPQTLGYLRQDGMIFSDDGVCRPFDVAASGTVGGNGCGVVVLRRLQDAQAAGERILAVIRGSAVNNDGNAKIGYTAPGMDGQSRVLREAMAVSGVEPASIGYIETHGTGTELGDPIEFQALCDAFNASCVTRPYCALGSVKANIGHLDSAAGIVSLIKTVLALQHRRIPPLANFTQINPRILLENQPFYIPQTACDWPMTHGVCRAGVSSFGFGGTNAHVQLEEWRPVPLVTDAGNGTAVSLLISAASEAQCHTLVAQWRERFVSASDEQIRKAGYASFLARQHHKMAIILVACTPEALRGGLQTLDDEAQSRADCHILRTSHAGKTTQSVAWMFGGQAVLNPEWNQSWYQRGAVFRATVAQCSAFASKILDASFETLLLTENTALLQQPRYAQPALFVLQAALAAQWQAWGVKPMALLGHSIGEYAAAWVAGCFSLEQALALVLERGRLVDGLDEGAMLALQAPPEKLDEWLQDIPADLAAINTPDLRVYSGEVTSLSQLADKAKQAGCFHRWLTVNRAMHSRQMSTIQAHFRKAAGQILAQPPAIRFYSTVTGQRLETAPDADYWVRHLRQTVLFTNALEQLQQDHSGLLLEIGADDTLCKLACRQYADKACVASLTDKVPPALLADVALAGLHCLGGNPDWRLVWPENWRGDLALPGYPFAGKRFATPLLSRRWSTGGLDFTGISGAAGRQAERGVALLEPERFRQARRQLEHFSQVSIREALCQVLPVLQQDTPVLLAELLQQTPVVTGLRQYTTRLIMALAQQGFIHRHAAGGYSNLQRPTAEEIQQAGQQTAFVWQHIPQLRSVFLAIASGLPEILRGQRSALEVIHSAGSLDQALSIYSDTPTSRYFNAILREAFRVALAGLPPDACIRVLEIGAGSGATAQRLLPLMEPQTSEYLFTDISPHFIQAASQQLAAEFPFARFMVFDAAQPPQSAGLQTGSVDIVVAVNVLHALADLQSAIASVQWLLAPGGIFMLYELTDASFTTELSTGVLIGTVTDALRGHQVFIDVDTWRRGLLQAGFETLNAFPKVGSAADVAGEHVLIARKPGDYQCRESLQMVRDTETFCYCWQWETVQLSSPVASAIDAWFVLMDQGMTMPALVENLKNQGETVIPLASLNELPAQLAAYGRPALVVCPGKVPFASENQDEQAQAGCFELLQWVKTLHQPQQPLTLSAMYILTCGAAIGLRDYACAAQSCLQGLARVIALGHAELNVRLIDTDGTIAPEILTQALLARRPWLALHQGQWYQPALAQSALPQTGETWRFSQHETALIIGGLGGVGSQLAIRLAQRGISKLVLTARHHAPLPSGLQPYASNIMVRQVDVTDESAMRRLLQEIDAECPPLTAVFHCAVDSRISAAQTPDERQRFAKVMAPKVRGGWLLHQLTSQRTLRYFVLFSSAVSIAPGYGLPHYVAANVFLDGLACWRRSLGLPAISISWGAWRDAGVVADAGQISRLEKGGLRSFSTAQGLDLLEQVVTSDMVHCGLVDMDWAVFLRQFADNALPPEYRYLYRPHQATTCQNGKIWHGADLAWRLRNQGQAQQQESLQAYLQQGFARLLGRQDQPLPLTVNLMELGVDSLMFLDAVNHIGRTLEISVSANALFRDFTISGITGQLLHSLNTQTSGQNLIILQADQENRYQPFPLTDVQQAYWVGRSDAIGLGEVSCYGYSEFDCLNLDVSRLETAWNQVVARHDMLRAIIRQDALQVILPQVPWYQIPIEDLRLLPEATRQTRLQQLRQQLSHQLRSTDSWPLFDIRVSQLTDETYRLHFGLDNIMTDGHSIDQMIQELVNIYQGNPLAEMPDISFRDYQIALQHYYQSEEYAGTRDYWLQRLDEIYPAPQLPLSTPLENLRAPRFVRRHFSMAAERWRTLRDQAVSQAGLTPSGLLLAAFSEVLVSWSASACFTLNVPTFNRLPLHPQINQIVGEFTSLILLSIDGAKAGGFADRARYIQQRLREDLRHEAFSGVQVMRELARRQTDLQAIRMPVVFTSTFGLNSEADNTHANRAQSVMRLGEEVYSISQTPQVLLDNHVHDQGGALHVCWDCVDAAFPDGVLQRMFDMYTRLLEMLVDTPNIWQSATPLTLPLADQQAWRQYNATTLAHLVAADQTLIQGFIDQCNKRGQATALVCAGQQLTYSQLGNMACCIAGALLAQGVSVGQPVGLMCGKSPQQIAAVLGIVLAGAAYVPLDAEFPKARLRSIIQQFGEDMPVLLDDGCLADGCVALDIAEALRHRPVALQARGKTESLAYVIFTSGTSGVPKGVAVTHHAALTTINDINRRLQVTENDVLLGVSALGFDLSVYDIFGLLAQGGCLVLPEEASRKESQYWMALIQQYRVTLWNSAPVYLQMLLQEPQGDITSLRSVLISGDWIALTLPDQLRCRAPDAAFYSLGGATEAAIWSVCYPVVQVATAWTSIPYGYPLANQRLYVLDDRGQPRPVGVSGELWIAGDGLAQGYWADETRTAEAFMSLPGCQERGYRTGDMARLHAGGYLEFLGRKDNQVKIRGYRIELGEIEAALRRCDGVTDALVLAQSQPQAAGYSALVAYLILQDDRPLEIPALRQQLAHWLPSFMIPAHWLVQASWPVTANGKIDRKALPAPEHQPRASDSLSATTVTKTETRLLQVLSGVLGETGLTRETNLFEAGFDSLMLAKASVALREAGMRLALRDFFLSPKVAQLAQLIEENAARDRPSCVLQRASRGGKTVFCLHGALGGGEIFAPLCHGLPENWGYQAPDLQPDADQNLQDWALAQAERISTSPDILIGHSAGGLLAWQLAAAFQQRGQPVSWLILIDSVPLSADKGTPLQAFASLCDVTLSQAASLEDVFQQLAASHPLAMGGLMEFTEQFQRFTHFLNMVSRFQPEHLVSTRIDLLFAKDTATPDMQALWTGIGHVNTGILQGDHLHCLRDQGLRQLLAWLLNTDPANQSFEVKHNE